MRVGSLLLVLTLVACGRPAPATTPGVFDEEWSQGSGEGTARAPAHEAEAPAAGENAADTAAADTAAADDAAAASASEAETVAPPAAASREAEAAPHEDTAPPGATELTLEELGWPADTRSVEIRRTSHVLARPDRRAHPLGKIVDGTRVTWRRVIAVEDRRCKRWIELHPRGWVCLARVAPRSAEPAADVQPVVTGRSLVPGTYYDVADGGTQSYASVDDIRAGLVKEELTTLVMVRSRGEVEVDGVDYQRTNRGYVRSSDLVALSPSSWAGVDLRVTPPPAWPFAFVHRRGGIRLRAAPERKAPLTDRLPSRALVALGAEQGGYVEVAPGGWAPRDELRRVALTAPPAGVGPDDRWIDVDLDEQVLVAYRGTTPELATLVSTGVKRGTTIIGTYRVRSMAATMRMMAEPHESKQYDVGEVPWAIRFRKGLFLHAAYWHDGFGSRRSAGCVNLSPRDARALYEWVGGVPAGWSEVEVERGRGLVVRIRDAANPDPPMYDYADEATP